jgi:hypothetical protein
MATNIEPYRVEPLTDRELTDIRLKAVAARAECVGGKDEENLHYLDQVLSLIAEVRRLRGGLDDQIRQAYARFAHVQERAKSPQGTALGERIMGDASGRYEVLQDLRRTVYGSALPEPS